MLSSLGFVQTGPVKVSIGWDKGLVQNKQQAIVWTSVDPVHWFGNQSPGDYFSIMVPTYGTSIKILL